MSERLKSYITHAQTSIADATGMEPHQDESYELQCRKLLLDFYSSRLQTHSRLIIGFAIILLTLFDIKLRLISISPIQSQTIYSAIFLVALAFWFSLMRLFTYGLFANVVIRANPKGAGTLFVRIRNGVTERVLKEKILKCIPSCLFISARQKYEWIQRIFGIGLCAFFLCFQQFLCT